MFTKKRRLSVLVGGILLAVVATLAPGAPAQAAGGSSLGVPFVYQPQQIDGLSVLPRTFTAGDCRLEGLNQTDDFRADIEVAGGAEFYDANDVLRIQLRLTWHATVYTISTWFGDIWHATFVFRDVNGTELFRTTFDATMLQSGTIYHYSFDNNYVEPTALQAATIATVDWLGDC